MPACGIRNNGARGAVFPEPASIVKNIFKNRRNGGRGVPGRRYKIAALESLRLDDCNNLVGARIDDHNLLTNQNVVVAAPFRIDDDDLLR